jgi:hypothetical protein
VGEAADAECVPYCDSNKIYGVGGMFAKHHVTGHMGKGALMSKADYIILDFVFGAHQEAANILEFCTALGVTSLCLQIWRRLLR